MITIIVAFVICLGILIFVHEFGHFIVAKAIGIKVEKFSLGFGPKIPGLGFKKGDTEYMVSTLPLGGYVKMAGENPDEELKGKPFEFYSRTPWERMQVVFSGPMMNLILAAALMSAVFLLGKKIPLYLTMPPTVEWIEQESPAQEAGFQIGDKIISINDQKIADWEELQTQIAANAGAELQINVKRNKKIITLTATPNEVGAMGLGSLGIQHLIPPNIGDVTGNPAKKAGLEAGDLIISVNGIPVRHWFDMAHLIQEHPEEQITLTIQRGEDQFPVEIVPALDPETQKGLIGITQPVGETIVIKYGLLASMQKGLAETIKLTKLTFEFLYKLIQGKTSPKSLGGPIMIAQIAGASAKSGMTDFLYFMAFLSLQLGILNLFPIPVLDGGHLLFFIIEMISGKPMSIRKREIAQQIGFSILILLMVYVFYNDIMRFFVH